MYSNPIFRGGLTFFVFLNKKFLDTSSYFFYTEKAKQIQCLLIQNII